jgi:exodeoxyribonuclease VII large subunit
VSREDPLTLDLFGGEAEPAPEVEESSTGDAAAPGEEPAPRGAAASPESDTEGAGPGVAEDAPAPDEPRVWTVSEVNRAVRNLLEGTLPTLWVSGEVGGWKRARSGHCYFTLKDDRAQLRCVLFRNDAARLPTDPDEGMEVRVLGRLTLYEARGAYQLVASRLEAGDAEGLWRLAFEKLRKKLDAEGLLAPERKQPLPRFPSCVGVVTSSSGAAIRDVLTVVRRRAPWTRVVVRGCRVQGEGAAVEIAQALRSVYRSGLADVVIVGRGGGSVEDLWAFNEEPVARAIADAPVPVISAVGHEVDVTIADLVADLRAATPSAGAEAAVQDGRALLEGLRELPPRMSTALRGSVARRREAAADAGTRMGRALEGAVARRGERARLALAALDRAARRVLERRRQRLATAAGKLDALSPLSTLRRGYAVALDDAGRVLGSVDDFSAGGRFDLRVADGRVRAEALEVRRSEPPGAVGDVATNRV